MSLTPQNNVSKESLIVVRDRENKIIAVVSKNGQNTEIYETQISGFEEIADLLQKLSTSNQ